MPAYRVANDWIKPQRRSIDFQRADVIAKFFELAHKFREDEGADEGPFGAERPGQDFPAAIDFSNDRVGTAPDVVKDCVAEFTVIHGLDRRPGDAVRVYPA